MQQRTWPHVWPWSVFLDQIQHGVATTTRFIRRRFAEILILISVTGLAYMGWIAWRQ